MLLEREDTVGEVSRDREVARRERFAGADRGVDLDASQLRVGASKTDAGVREAALLPALRDELAALRAAGDRDVDELVFGTTSGHRRNPSKVRNRALALSVERANEPLAARGAPRLLTRLRPHSLRRTYASLMFAIGSPAPDVMEQLGHTDARLTLRVDARAMRQGPEERDRLKALVEGR